LELLLERFRRRFRVPSRAVVEVTIADDELLEELNRKYRRRSGPTDVLAFEIGREPTEPSRVWLWAEVYVSLPRARAQAKERGVPLIEEVEALTVHGLLHLAGYDHGTARSRMEMERIAEGFLAHHRNAIPNNADAKK